MRIAINGLGRIGRKLVKNILELPQFDLIAINDIMPIDMAVYFLKYDSTYGLSSYSITHDETHVIIQQRNVKKKNIPSQYPIGICYSKI